MHRQDSYEGTTCHYHRFPLENIIDDHSKTAAEAFAPRSKFIA